MFVKPQDHVYEGQLVGMNARSDDMVVNPCRAKKATNMRAAGSDDTIKLTPPRTFTLEEALEFIDDDGIVVERQNRVELFMALVFVDGRPDVETPFDRRRKQLRFQFFRQAGQRQGRGGRQ